MTELVLARNEDIGAYVDILNEGREFQRAQGFVQWPDGYPDKTDVAQDIQEGKGYALHVDGEVAAYFYLGFDGDPAYPEIKGAWRFDEPYAVIHRVAIAKSHRGRGLMNELFRLAGAVCLEQGVACLRIDTDEQNKRMRHVLEKNGFVCCGTVIQGGGDRLAFDKKLK